ncbi:ABC transporter substrate-binding protein [Thermobifida fusca]|jgi:NitT/TauT family transport system substrate-binding protein|nr:MULTISPECIES: ABC transporter substrate-binding protein [Thermobifida]MDD6793514.1 ABC transporter substrate-binding protein [Thermobifida fusca]
MGSARRSGAFRALALAAALTFTLSACGPSESDGPAQNEDGLTTVRVGLAEPTFNTALINLVIDEDIDANHGLDMQPTRSGAGSTNQIAALRAGEYDFAGVGTATAADAVAEGAGLVIVAGTGGLINNIVLNADVAKGLDVAPDDPVEERIKALRGLTIATSPPGSSSNLTLRHLVQQHGLDPDKDLNIVPVTDTSSIVAGIRQGKFDGSFFGVGVADANIADGSGTLWISLPRGDIEEFNELIGVCIVSTREFVDNNPEIVEAFHAALAEAQEFVASDPEAAGKALHENSFANLDADVFATAWEQAQTGYPEGVLFTRENWETYLELFGDASDKDLESIVYEDFVAEPARGES